MGEWVRLIRAEMKKIQHTFLPVMHLLIPAFGVLLFLTYYANTSWERKAEWSGYIQALAIVLPTVIAVLCSMSVSLEEQNHFFVFLGISRQKTNVLLAKWFALALLCLGALVLAVGGFASGQKALLGREMLHMGLYVETVIILWLCSLNLYLFHLFLSIQWSGTLSICIGAVGSLITTLFQTGLGDRIWQFFICSFGSRWSEYLLLYWLGEGTRMPPEYFFKVFVINIVITVILWIAVLIWFSYYEGRRSND